VTSVSGYGNAFGTQIDWAYKSINQTYAAGTIQTLRAGKAIGGTSTINGMPFLKIPLVHILTRNRNELCPSRGYSS
jgi:hypothetical protein